MKLTGKQLRTAVSALTGGMPESFVSNALGVDKGTARYWKSHRPDHELAFRLIAGDTAGEPPVKAVKTK